MLLRIQENLFFITSSANYSLKPTYSIAYAHSHLLNAVIADCNPVPPLAGEGWMAKGI
jgi:hypothetical protein